MTGLVETIWLFVRAGESVRMIRASTPEGGLRLIIYGPGNAQTVHEFRDSMTTQYRERTGVRPEIYVCAPSQAGAACSR